MKGSEMEKPYQARYGYDKKYYVSGPSPGGECSYYGGTLYGSLRTDSEDEARRSAMIANIAFAEGYRKAQADMRAALGIGG